ncbi:MAG: hypothetical protein IJU16_04365 [Clostridia bacterium]|nr:hypothetical protein [Clostridia bacterium]
MKHKIFSRIGALTLVVSIALSLCSCSSIIERIQRVLLDYVTINLDNGVLLSQSDNNEQIWTYEITGCVTNDSASNLKKATVTFDIPANATVSEDGDKAKIENLDLAIGESKNYRWVVKIPMTQEDQTIEYSVTVDSDDIDPITAYADVFVKGKNKNDNRFDFSSDTWRFRNFSTTPVCLTQEDYDAMLVGLDHTSVEFINKKIEAGCNGYCYGFAASSILVKMKALKVEDIDSSKSKLHDVESTTESKSVLAYHWLTQYFSCVADEIATFNQNDTAAKLSIIEGKAKAVESGGVPFILSFTLGENKGHAIVGYSYETGKWEKAGKTYNSRILTYDSNKPKWNEDSCLYYNANTAEWCIPNYPGAREIIQALSDVNIINVKALASNKKSAYSYLHVTGSDDLSIYDGNNVMIGSIEDGALDGQSREGVVAFRPDDVSDVLTIAIPKTDVEESYTVQSHDEALDVCVQYENYYMSAATPSNDAVTFDPNGMVALHDDVSNYEMEIVANTGHYATDWYKVQIKGEKGQDPTIAVGNDGYLITGNDLGKLEVYADNGTTAERLDVPGAKTPVLLTQTGGDLCAKTDEDADGSYESVLAVGRMTERHNPFSSTDTFNWWILVWIIGGLVIAAGIAIGVKWFLSNRRSTVKHPRKKKNKTNSADDEWWNL